MARKRTKTTEVQTTLSGQDAYDLESMAHALGIERSALIRQWVAEKLELIRRCNDIKKAEERALLNNPNFVRYGQNQAL